MKVEVGLQFKNLHFNPTFGFVHILPKFGFKQPSIVYSVVVFSGLLYNAGLFEPKIG